MVLSDEKLELCKEKLRYLFRQDLRELINDIIISNMNEADLRELIEDKFTSDDWEWFYEEYIEEAADVH